MLSIQVALRAPLPMHAIATLDTRAGWLGCCSVLPSAYCTTALSPLPLLSGWARNCQCSCHYSSCCRARPPIEAAAAAYDAGGCAARLLFSNVTCEAAGSIVVSAMAYAALRPARQRGARPPSSLNTYSSLPAGVTQQTGAG